MSIGYEESDEEEEEFTSNTQSISVSLPAWLVIAIDEKCEHTLAKRSTIITNDLEKLPKYSKERKRILKEMNVGTGVQPEGPS